MNISDIVITPALSLDPELLCQGDDGESIFRTVLDRSMLGKARTYGTFRLYRASDILAEIPTVADYLFRVTKGGRDRASLLGGYAFLDREQFLFGAEHAYAFYKEWDVAFKRIEHTSPVDVVIDQHRFKLIKRATEIVICQDENKIVIPLVTFLSRAADAMSENKKLKQKLTAELRRRFGGAECDLAEQLDY